MINYLTNQLTPGGRLQHLRSFLPQQPEQTSADVNTQCSHYAQEQQRFNAQASYRLLRFTTNKIL